MITYTRFCELLNDAQKCTLDDFVATNQSVDAMQTLVAIWTVGHDGVTMKSISKAFSRSVRNIALTYGINERTAMSWSAEEQKPKDWIIKALAYIVMSDNPLV